MPLPQRLQEIRDGFERPFWVANISEIFERLSYYGAFSSLALYLHEKLDFSPRKPAPSLEFLAERSGFSPSSAAQSRTTWDFAEPFPWRTSFSPERISCSAPSARPGSAQSATPCLCGCLSPSCSSCRRWEFRW